MSKFELFKKLNLLIQISGIKDDPRYCGMLNVSRPSPSDAYKSQFAESSDLVSGVNNERIDTYPNPMAVKYLMNICEDVLLSKVPNRKDEFQLATLAFHLAVSRLSLAIAENKLYEFHKCEPLTQNYNNGLSSGSSLGNELRHILDTFKLNSEYIESAVSNTLTYSDNSGYVKRLDVDPKVCVLYPIMRQESFVDIVKYDMFGQPKPDAIAPAMGFRGRAPARSYVTAQSALAILGMIDVEVNLADDDSVTTIRPTLFGKSLFSDLEASLINWNIPDWGESSCSTVDPIWYRDHIESVPGLINALYQLLKWNSFEMYQSKLDLDDHNNRPRLASTKPSSPADEKAISKGKLIIRKAKESTLALNKVLNDVSIRLALTQFGLVVRNPLYDARDEVLCFNPPLILSGFGIVVALHDNSKVGEEADDE